MKKKFYITTSIAYTNAPPHIGFALELIQADALVRHHRLSNEEVFFLTGTDEHGRKVTEAAAESKKSPEAFSNEISAKFKKLTKILNISNDDFIRTTDKIRHWPAVKKVWLKLKANGDIYKKKYKGFYCVGCEAFITKKDLIGGKCKIHQKVPQAIEEENYFFRLSKYSKEIGKIIRNNQIRIIPQTRKNEMLNFAKKGLEDISFSRPRKDLKWGIPVPDDNNQTIYCWADALTNYVSLIGYADNKKSFKNYWPADIHCFGKDIQKFHCLIWPGMLLSLKLSLPKKMFIHGFITVDGQKMSKSLGNIVNPFELVKKYGTDPVRYFLLREIPPTNDGDFTYQKFEARYNSDLAKGLGNLVARVITMAKNLPEGSRFGGTYGAGKFQAEVNKAQKNYKKALDNFRFNEVLIAVWELISFCDKYIEKERPWENKNQKVISNLLLTISNIAEMLRPFLPETSEKIFRQLKTQKSKPLFPRI